jgi:hypothetical protein
MAGKTTKTAKTTKNAKAATGKKTGGAGKKK